VIELLNVEPHAQDSPARMQGLFTGGTYFVQLEPGNQCRIKSGGGGGGGGYGNN
jgi:hypothetical protein